MVEGASGVTGVEVIDESWFFNSVLEHSVRAIFNLLPINMTVRVFCKATGADGYDTRGGPTTHTCPTYKYTASIN